MYCSPLLSPSRTTIPPAFRDWLGSFLAGPRRRARPQRHRVCLYALGQIGDFVLTLGALRLLLREFGPENCVLVVPTGLALIVRREFPGVAQITLPPYAASLVRDILPAWWRERRKLSGHRFEQLISLCHQRDLYHELALSWIDAEKELRLMPATYPAGPHDGLCTELLAHQRLVETVLGRPVSRAEILPAFTCAPVSEDGRLLVYPLANAAIRCLPLPLTIAVLHAWRKRSRAPIVLAGSPAEGLKLQLYAEAARLAGVHDVQVETPAGIEGFLTHVALAGALLASDSAATHIGAALDKPTVVLMERRIWGYCQPWRRSARQQAFLYDTPVDQVAAALPAL